MKHVAISAEEAADRVAIRELVEAYAHCADRRDARGQMSLFTPDTHFVVFMDAKNPKPSQDLHSREALAPVFADLNKYEATTHFLGQNNACFERRSGDGRRTVSAIFASEEKRSLFVPSLRYYDVFVKAEGKWLFRVRKLIVDCRKRAE